MLRVFYYVIIFSSRNSVIRFVIIFSIILEIRERSHITSAAEGREGGQSKLTVADEGEGGGQAFADVSKVFLPVLTNVS